MKVAVIINVYNGEIFIARALESLLAQTHTNIRIIVWDNMSQDRTTSIVRSYCDPRIELHVAEKHVNLAAARIEALRLVVEPAFAFLDVDDLWLPEKLEKQIAILDDSPDWSIIFSRTKYDICSDTVWARRFRKSETKIPRINKLNLYRKNFIPLVSALFNTRLLDIEKLNPNYVQCEDYDLILQLSEFGGIYAHPEVLCTYSVHDNNLSSSQQLEDFEEVLDILGRQPNSLAKFMAILERRVKFLLGR